MGKASRAHHGNPMKLYRNFTSQEEIDAEYNIGASMPGWESWLDRYAEDSEATRRALDCELDIPFGPTLDEHMDIFPAAKPGSPILVFIHGGYWRALTSKEHSFVARSFVEQGITVAVLNYALCPKVNIAEISRQCRAALAWLNKHAADYNGDGQNIFVSGHSAGGHLTATVCSTDWKSDYGLPNDFIRGGIPISGIFDLQPMRYSYLQPVLMLDDETIRRYSPCLNIPQQGPPLLLSVGEKESSEFHRQARDYQALWQSAGSGCEFQVEKDDDHFSILQSLGDVSKPLFTNVMALIRAAA